MEMSRIFWIHDITDWWPQQGQTHSKCTDLTNVARDIFSIIPYGVGVEASFSLGRDVINRRQSPTTGETHRENIVVWQFAQANDRILASTDLELDTTTQKTTRKWSKRRRKRNFIQWRRFMTFWRCGRVGKTYMLSRRNHALKTSRWLP